MVKRFRDDEFKVSMRALYPESNTIVDIHRKLGLFKWRKICRIKVGGNVRACEWWIGKAMMDANGDKAHWL